MYGGGVLSCLVPESNRRTVRGGAGAFVRAGMVSA